MSKLIAAGGLGIDAGEVSKLIAAGGLGIDAGEVSKLRRVGELKLEIMGVSDLREELWSDTVEVKIGARLNFSELMGVIFTETGNRTLEKGCLLRR